MLYRDDTAPAHSLCQMSNFNFSVMSEAYCPKTSSVTWPYNFDTCSDCAKADCFAKWCLGVRPPIPTLLVFIIYTCVSSAHQGVSTYKAVFFSFCRWFACHVPVVVLSVLLLLMLPVCSVLFSFVWVFLEGVVVSYNVSALGFKTDFDVFD